MEKKLEVFFTTPIVTHIITTTHSTFSNPNTNIQTAPYISFFSFRHYTYTYVYIFIHRPIICSPQFYLWFPLFLLFASLVAFGFFSPLDTLIQYEALHSVVRPKI